MTEAQHCYGLRSLGDWGDPYFGKSGLLNGENCLDATMGLNYFSNYISKDQLISKCLFGIFNSPKKRTKKFDFTTMVPQVELFSFVFGDKTLKRHFKINWPLVYDWNHYFGLGPIPKSMPEMVDIFGLLP